MNQTSQFLSSWFEKLLGVSTTTDIMLVHLQPLSNDKVNRFHFFLSTLQSTLGPLSNPSFATQSPTNFQSRCQYLRVRL